MFRLDAPGGAYLLVRRHGASELALWLPADLAPGVGEPFGLYLHPDRSYAARARAASTLARRIGRRSALRQTQHPQAHRQVAMLCIHDLSAQGAALRDIGEGMLDPMPDDWRMSSQRSDLRRLADTAAQLIAGNYRTLLRGATSNLGRDNSGFTAPTA